MGMFKNTQKISSITFRPKNSCHNLCPLGQLYCDELAKDGSKPLLPHYTNQFTIDFVPGEFVCDYIDVEKWIDQNLNNETLIIEDCVAMLFDYINTTYKPKWLQVESFVDDALHGPVKVTRVTESKEIL